MINYLCFISEDLDLSGIEISESRAEGMGRGIREWIDEGIRWLFRVGVEREWSVFGATVGALGLLSWIATHFDLLTIVYMGESCQINYCCFIDFKKKIFVFVMGLCMAACRGCVGYDCTCNLR